MSMIKHPFDWMDEATYLNKLHQTSPKKLEEAVRHVVQADDKPILTYKQAFELVSETSITGEEVRAKFHLVEG